MRVEIRSRQRRGNGDEFDGNSPQNFSCAPLARIALPIRPADLHNILEILYGRFERSGPPSKNFTGLARVAFSSLGSTLPIVRATRARSDRWECTSGIRHTPRRPCRFTFTRNVEELQKKKNVEKKGRIARKRVHREIVKLGLKFRLKRRLN